MRLQVSISGNPSPIVSVPWAHSAAETRELKDVNHHEDPSRINVCRVRECSWTNSFIKLTIDFTSDFIEEEGVRSVEWSGTLGLIDLLSAL